MVKEVRCTMPVIAESANIRRQGPYAVYYNVVFVDAEGRKWLAEDGKFHYDLKAVGAYYVGYNTVWIGEHLKLIAGPFDTPPEKLGEGQSVFTLREDGNYEKV